VVVDEGLGESCGWEGNLGTGMKENGSFCSICIYELTFSGRWSKSKKYKRTVQSRKNCFSLFLASLFFKPNSEFLSKQQIATSLCLQYLISLSMVPPKQRLNESLFTTSLMEREIPNRASRSPKARNGRATPLTR
jgi:hypothetical protein